MTGNQLGTSSARLRHRCLIVASAMVPALFLSACSTSPHDSERLDATREPAKTATTGCTQLGSYLIIPSTNGSFPLLPPSKLGKEFTPLVALAGTKAYATPPTAEISIAAEAPDPSPAYFNDMRLGSEATFNGYTIRITSICDKDVLFDLVKQPE